VVAAQRLRELLPPDVEVHTMAEFVEKEKQYWAERTPIGFVIGASMMVAMIVGAVIVYQILYTDVTDHLPEYATLKSIGFTDGYFIRLVLQESIILSVLGFIPGTLLSAFLYWLTRMLAHMPTHLNAVNVLAVFGLSLGMCLLAGWLATRKLRQANPADIF
jgi:putative ABC transport system permease protein